MTVLRRVKFSELYEKGYRWDGRCRCGARDWERRLWDGGYSNHCLACGWWECTHSLRGVSHTSEGIWAPLPGAKSVREPAGCPCLAEGSSGECSAPETNAQPGKVG